MVERGLVLQTIQKRMEQRIDHSVENLLANKEINAHVAKLPALKHVLRFGIASGKIPEQHGQQNALQLIQRALHGAEVGYKLDTRIRRGVGKPPRLAAEVQETLANSFQQHDQHASLAQDKTFSIYLRKMALNLYELGHTAKELKENQLLSNAILYHIATEYQLMHELRVPPHVIRTFGHQFTVFQADQVYRDATRVFGADEEAKPLIRTAAVQLFMKKYDSIEQAKKAYDRRLAEVHKTARKVQLRGLKLPELNGLARDQALTALKPIIKRIGQNFRQSLLGQRDAEQTALLTALELLETGERNAEKIMDAVIQKVTKEAAIHAFSRVTQPLPEEK